MHSDFNSYRVGLRAEWFARMYLRMHGYKILSSRYMTGRNTNRAEIDIIARRNNLIVFVEVKRRATINAAWNAITPAQESRLRLAAQSYLSKIGWRGDARFDVMIIRGVRICWIKNAI